MGMGWVSAFQRFPCRGEAGLLGNTLPIRSIWVHPWLNLTTAVNAKTPRGKGARDRKMTREKQVCITHPGE